jgi:imidazolonepropionase-like amidohydrolase
MDSGLMPFQAIKLALARLRHCSNLDDRGVGKLAPIVVVDGNPAAGIRDIHKIEAVWHRGEFVSGRIQTLCPEGEQNEVAT